MKKSKIKIGIADDHTLFMKGFVGLLKEAGFSNISFMANNGKEVFEYLGKKEIDLLFLDIGMPVMDGKETIEKLKIEHPHVKVIMLTGHNNDDFIVQFIKLGARAFLLKDCDLDVLVKAITQVNEIGNFYDEKITSLMSKVFSEDNNLSNNYNLTSRELEIIHMMCNNVSRKKIAGKLFISVRTFDAHWQHIKNKTKCTTPLELEWFVKKNNLFKK